MTQKDYDMKITQLCAGKTISALEMMDLEAFARNAIATPVKKSTSAKKGKFMVRPKK